MNIGLIIKTKRQQKDLTQEQFAEYFNVSISAVSQWESGKTVPDFSLLIPLAEFFDITLDELLGRTPGEKEKAIADYDLKDRELTSRGEVDAAITLWREAISRFPGDIHCMYMLMSNLFLSYCAKHGNETSEKKAQECISLGECILLDSTDDEYRQGAIQTLTYIYSSKELPFSDESKAVRYASMAGDAVFSRQELLEHAYFTKESKDKRLEIKHYNRLFYAERLTLSLIYDGDIPKEYYLKALETSLNIWKQLIFDENYLFYHIRLSDIYSYIASIHAGNSNKKETLEALEKSLIHARKYDALPKKEQHFTSAFVCAAASDPSKCSKNYTETQTQLILKRTKQNEFDFLQDDSDFLSLTKKYVTV